MTEPVVTASSGRYAAVVGKPIAHSLSPLLHSSAYAALGLNWSYRAIETDVGELAALLESTEMECAGFSVTMPLKREALAVAHELSPVAQAVGAANTLLPGMHGWRATNTDVDGVSRALTEAGVTPQSVTILGAGGSAQAAIAALDLHIPCTVLVRDPARASEAAATAQRLGRRLRVELLEKDAPALNAELVISTLPAGAADALAARPWRADQTIFDVLYHPWPTVLAAQAQAGGARVISGASMLLHQAAAQVELMTGLAAPLEAMRSALAVVHPM